MVYPCRILSYLTSIWLIIGLAETMQSDNAINQQTRHLDTEHLFNMVESLAKKVESLEKDAQDQKETIYKQKVTINALETTVKQHETRITEMSLQPAANNKASNQQISDMEYQHTTFGCFSDVLNLTCPDSCLINVTRAYYGMFFFACDSGCCAPHPTFDCSELVEENRPADWLAILASCNGQENCTYENRGSPIDECQEAYLADWLQIFYQCTPVPLNDPMGFTAYAPNTLSISYGEGEHAKFPNVVTNLGGYYNTGTSVFICPIDGVYIFITHGHNVDNDMWFTYIMRENTDILAANAYSSVDQGHTGATLITECNAGEQVWIMGEGTMRGFRGSHFTGYLLHRF